jgi:outer membrane biosynthesis protein TonB
VIFVGAWVFLRSHASLPLSSSDQSSSGVAEAPAPFPVATTPVESTLLPASFETQQELEQPAVPAGMSASSPAVLHEVTPEIPQKTLAKIRGHVKVTVRVLVDPAGNVVGDLLENPGPSRWFARKAREAAADWKFAPVDDKGSRVWLLHFDFSRGGVAADSTFVQ